MLLELSIAFFIGLCGTPTIRVFCFCIPGSATAGPWSREGSFSLVSRPYCGSSCEPGLREAAA